MTYTPGPWKAVKYLDVVSVTIHAGGLSIGRMTRLENALLVAASPELLACIQSFVRRFGSAVKCDEEINGGDAVDWISENMPKFRAAIKKAEGRN